MTRPADAASVLPARYTVAVQYDMTEDRLLLHCRDGAGHVGLLQLTRRITGALLQGLMRLLAHGGPKLLQVPAGLQQEMLHFEHQSALAQAVISHTAQAPAPPVQPQLAFLVTAVNVSQTPEGAYALSWTGTQGQAVTLTMSRVDLHCLTHVLQQHAGAAGWDLPALPSWMQPGDASPVARAALS